MSNDNNNHDAHSARIYLWQNLSWQLEVMRRALKILPRILRIMCIDFRKENPAKLSLPFRI